MFHILSEGCNTDSKQTYVMRNFGFSHIMLTQAASRWGILKPNPSNHLLQDTNVCEDISLKLSVIDLMLKDWSPRSKNHRQKGRVYVCTVQSLYIYFCKYVFSNLSAHFPGRAERAPAYFSSVVIKPFPVQCRISKADIKPKFSFLSHIYIIRNFRFNSQTITMFLLMSL